MGDIPYKYGQLVNMLHTFIHTRFIQTDMKSALIIVGVVLAAVALGDARSPLDLKSAPWTGGPYVESTTKPTATHVWLEPRVPIANTGECKVCPCPKIMKPVCGVNKVTYDNKCIAKCAGVMFFPGPCKRN